MATLVQTTSTSRDVLRSGAWISRAVVVVALVLVPLVALLPGSASNAAVLALAATGLIVGLPHGALDHRVAAGLSGRPLPVVAAAYAVAAALAWVVLSVVGAAAVVVALAVSVAHFAIGELEVVRETTGWHPARPAAAAVALAGTGALLLPLARSGDLLSQVAAAISPQLGTLIGATPVRLALGGAWTLAALVAIAAAAHQRHYVVVVDILLVGALGALAPPLLAFALWFGGWHGLRHCARLLMVDERCAELVREGRTSDSIRALARLAAWPTIAAATTLAALTILTVTAPDATAALGATLVVLLALTVPHMVVVGWLDLRARRPSRPAR